MVHVYYKNITNTKVDSSIMYDMKKCVRETVKREYSEGEFEVYITVCDNEYIHSLNKEYRGVDRPTDVLSFPMDDFDLPGGLKELGDIVISIDKAEEQAKEYGHSQRREMCFLCVHSTLHLLGYDHETGEEDRIKMEKMQGEILDSLGITRD